MTNVWIRKLLLLGIVLIAAVGGMTSAQDPQDGKVDQERPVREKISDTATGGRPATETLLPISTKAWVSIPNATRLIEQFETTELGKLASKPELKPFVEEMKKRFHEFMDQKNVRLGITLEDIKNVRTGEVCLAGVLENDSSNVKGMHGIVLLADISGNEEKANELLKKVTKEMENLGAKPDAVEPIADVEIKKWIVPRVKDPKMTFDTYQAICDGWLVATDNKSTLREVLLRIKSEQNVQALRRLADDESFRAIQDRVQAEGLIPELRWFVEPFGYIELAQAIREEEAILRKRKDDYSGKLRQNGFDTLRGVGGILAVNQFEFDIAYRTFAYTAANNVQGELRKRALEILDFRNVNKDDLKPWSFISDDYSSHFGMTWNILKAYDNVGPVVDIFGGEDFFKSFEKSFIDDLKINLREMVSNLGNRISVVSATRLPIGNDSERMAVIIPLNGDKAANQKFFADLKKAVKSGDVKTAEGIEYIEDSREAADDDADIDVELDRFKEFEEDDDKGKKEEKKGQEIKIFEKRFFAIVNNFLVVASHQDVLVEFARGAASKPMAESEEYRYVETVLKRLVNVDRASFREFGRLDRELKNNYQMFREGKMGQSHTALGRLLNQFLSIDSEDPNYVRQQKFDGSSLPEDFDGVIAPMIGFSGWALETQDDGWLMSGGIIKKKGVSEIVEKPKDIERR